MKAGIYSGKENIATGIESSRKELHLDEYENQWDKLLKIRTTGRDDSHADQYRYPYEPTDYRVLERLANSGDFRKKNTLLDYGCGKGRVAFFMSYQTGCKSIGIEFDDRIFRGAAANLETAVNAHKVHLCCRDAMNYPVPTTVDRCLFFNPFSVEILRKVISRILDSYYEEPREMRLYFYYPSDEYISYLMTVPELSFADEIDCHDLFPGNNPRERVLIFEIV